MHVSMSGAMNIFSDHGKEATARKEPTLSTEYPFARSHAGIAID